jgi:hypothetical protein
MRQILVVANQTLGGERLKEVVRERIDEGPCTFTLVVPVWWSQSYPTHPM